MAQTSCPWDPTTWPAPGTGVTVLLPQAHCSWLLGHTRLLSWWETRDHCTGTWTLPPGLPGGLAEPSIVQNAPRTPFRSLTWGRTGPRGLTALPAFVALPPLLSHRHFSQESPPTPISALPLRGSILTPPAPHSDP